MAKKKKGFKGDVSQFLKKPVEVIKTGIMGFDDLFTKEGGIPKGKFIEITSASGLGKTSLCLYAMRKLCEQGYKVVYMDFEDGVEDPSVESFGLTPYLGKEFLLYNPLTYRGTEMVLNTYMDDPSVAIIVIDSISAILPESMGDFTESIEDSNEKAVKAKLDKALLLKYKARLSRSGKSVIFITQRRANFSMNQGKGQKQTKAAVGKAFEFFMDIRIEMKALAYLKKNVILSDGTTEEVKYGVEAKVYCYKNRLNIGFIPVVLPIIYGKGVSQVLQIIALLQNTGYIIQRGSYYTLKIDDEGFKIEEKAQGKNKLAKLVKDNVDTLKRFVKEKNLFTFYEDL